MPGKTSDVPPNVRDKALYRRKRAQVKGRVRVWPSAYASGQLVQEYERAGGRYINPAMPLKAKQVMLFERSRQEKNPKEGLDKWFAEKWVDLGRSIDSKGHVKKSGWVKCGRSDSSKGQYPKCVPLAKAKKMTPKQRLSAVRRKRAAEAAYAGKKRGRKPVMVKTFKNPEPVFFVVVDTPRFTMVDSSHERGGQAMARKLELESSSEDPVRIVSGPEMAKVHKRAKKEGRIVRHTKVRGRIKNPRNSLVKDALRDEATKYESFDKFAEAYWNDCARGLYWVPTDDHRFHIGDAESDAIKKRKFLVYCNPEQALDAIDTSHVAEIDVTGIPRSYMSHTRGGKGTEIRITGRPGAIKVLRVLKAEKALRSFKYQQSLLPSSRAQLYKFWEDAWRREEKRREKEAARQKRLRQKEAERKRKQREEEKKREEKRREAEKKKRKERAQKEKKRRKKPEPKKKATKKTGRKISEAEAKRRLRDLEDKDGSNARPKRKPGAKTPKQKKAASNPSRIRRVSAYRNDG